MGSLVAFFSLTFLASWSLWIASAAVHPMAGPRTSGLAALGGLLYLIGVFAPALVALGLTARAEGRAGVQSLLRPLFRWEVGKRWYVFALTYMAAIKLTAALVHRAVTGEWPAFGAEPLYLMAIAIPFSTIAQAGEEIGWRGYALSPLSARLGLSGGSVVLGLLWALWHLPFFFLPGTDKTGQSFSLYLLGVVALSVALAWLYWKTGQSLLLAMLMHAAINNTKDIVPSAAENVVDGAPSGSTAIARLSVAILWICAAYFLVRMRRVRLAPGGQG